MESGHQHHQHQTVIGKEINLKAVMGTIKKRFWLIVVISAVLTGLAYMYSSRPEPSVYASSARVMIGADSNLMPTARVLAREPVVLDQVIRNMGLDYSSGTLRSQIRVDNVDQSLVTVITVLDSEPGRAADIANEIVSVYRVIAAETLGVHNIRLLTPAEPNANPINSQSYTAVYAVFVISLLIGLSCAFVLDSLDESIRSENDVESLLGLSVLGNVSTMKRKYASGSPKKQKQGMIRSESIGS